MFEQGDVSDVRSGEDVNDSAKGSPDIPCVLLVVDFVCHAGGTATRCHPQRLRRESPLYTH